MNRFDVHKFNPKMKLDKGYCYYFSRMSALNDAKMDYKVFLRSK